jgi:hypothetical protein
LQRNGWVALGKPSFIRLGQEIARFIAFYN